MNKKYHVLLLTIFYTLSMNVYADDIDLTPWTMHQQNAAHTGFVNVTLNPTTFKYDWKVYVGEQAASGLNYSISPAVVSGNLVFVSRHNYAYSNTLQAFSIKDGHEIWKKSYMSVGINPPALYKNKVFVQTVNNASPETALYCYDALTGHTIFKSPTRAQWEEYLAPTIYKENIYVVGGSGGGMYSFQRKTGKENWFRPLGYYDLWTPAVNERYAVGYTSGQLNVLDRESGQTITNISDSHYQWSGYSAQFAPVLLSEERVAAIQSGYLTVFDIGAKNVAWSKGPGMIGQPTYDGIYIYATQNDRLIAIDKITGKIKWEWKQGNERVTGQHIVTDNLIFVCTENNVYAISKKEHEVVWNYPASGTLSLGMGHLYIVEHSGNLISISVST